jgi:hypothetical protein
MSGMVLLNGTISNNLSIEKMPNQNPIEYWSKEKKLEKLANYSACQVNNHLPLY